MTPKAIARTLSPYDLAIEAAKLRTRNQIAEMRAAGLSMSQAMDRILKERNASSFLQLWRREVGQELKEAAQSVAA